MKIGVCSDLHLEFGDVRFTNTEGIDVLVLSGDICVASQLMTFEEMETPDLLDDPRYMSLGHLLKKSIVFHEFFKYVSKTFKTVIYIAGNHEYYHGPFNADNLKEYISHYENIHFLEKEKLVIGDVTFLGGTLWTDMNKADPLTLFHLTTMMNDFKIIYNESENRVFRPEDAYKEHKDFVEYIRLSVEGKFDEKFVVCGHHSPSKKSTKPQYEHDKIMNGGYSSDLEEFIVDHPQIKLWTHGHTHHEFNYKIGETEILCNPRGYYGYEHMNKEFVLKTFDV